jgi:hypothetical protein
MDELRSEVIGEPHAQRRDTVTVDGFIFNVTLNHMSLSEATAFLRQRGCTLGKDHGVDYSADQAPPISAHAAPGVSRAMLRLAGQCGWTPEAGAKVIELAADLMTHGAACGWSDGLAWAAA